MKSVLLTIALLVPNALSAQTVDPANTKSVIVALQDLGYRAQFDPSDSGRPRIRSAIAGVNYSIWFYGCDDSFKDCGALMFSSGFDMDNGLSMDVVNQWNYNKLVGRAYLDEENDPFIDFFIEADGGLPRETFEAVLESWEIALDDFQEEIDW